MQHAIWTIEDLLHISIEWRQLAPEPRWVGQVGGEVCTLVVNDFPAEPLHTGTWRVQSLDLDDAPAGWSIPLAE